MFLFMFPCNCKSSVLKYNEFLHQIFFPEKCLLGIFCKNVSVK